MDQEATSENQRSRILCCLGKAHDDIGRYAEAFSYYSAANDENSKRANFNASRHKKGIAEIKRVFREPHGSAADDSGDAEHVPVFVVGMSRSGKTSVESLLSQHENAYSVGDRFRWYGVIEKILKKYSVSELFPNCMSYLSDDQIKEMGSIYMQNILEDSAQSKILINTSPRNVPYIGVIFQALPMAKVIHCHRDPMDNCLSVYFRQYQGRYWDFSYDLDTVASFFVGYRDLMAHWQRLYGDRILDVRYEDLVRDPADIGARIFEYCGLDFDPAAVRDAFTTGEIGHWRHYEPYLGPLRQALGDLAR